MFKEIFLPERFRGRRILAQRIIGLAVQEEEVHLAFVHAKRNKTIIEKLVKKKIEPGPEETFSERAIQALKDIMTNVKSYDQIRIYIPSSIIVFKELVLQFTDPEKIRMVLEYEIEAMLPFSINNAIVDFIITKTKKEPQEAQVLVAAVRSQDLQTHLDMFTSAGINPTQITIDLFALYGLYQQIPEYRNIPHATALVELGLHYTRIALIQEGQLRLTRSITRGTATIIKLISEQTQVPIADIEQKLATSGIAGIADETLLRAVQKHFVLLLNDIQFTLNSFSLKINLYDGVNKVLFTGQIENIKDLMTFCSDTMQIPCEIFDCQKLLTNSHIKNGTRQDAKQWSHFAIALGTALPSPEQQDFDFRRKQFMFQRHGLIVKQLITACFLTLCILTTLAVQGYFDLSQLSHEATQLEQNEINKIKTEAIFPKNRLPKTQTLQAFIRDAEKIVKEKLDIFAPFTQRRLRALELWLELTRIINKQQFDVTIKEIIFTTEDKGWEREKDGSVKHDAGVPKVEVEGLFKSKTGDHFVDFGKIFENRFKESSVFKLIEPLTDERSAPEGGVNFTLKMIQKEA